VADARLLIIAKAPQAGRVKTRLVPPLTPREAAAVYEASLHDVVAGAAASGGAVHIVYDDCPGAAAYFERAFPAVPREPQSAGDLGARLAHAFSSAFVTGANVAVAIGADSPTLPASHLAQALAATRETGVALGPADDGGYYLLGLRRDAWPGAEGLFRDVPWSTNAVFEWTVRRAARSGLSVHRLPRWYDIDRIDDLRRARSDARPDSMLARLLAGGAPGGVNAPGWPAASGVPDRYETPG
jgi:uncharacterized protein